MSKKADSFQNAKAHRGPIKHRILAAIIAATLAGTGITRSATALATGIRLSSVAARANELVKDRNVFERGTAWDADTNRTVGLLVCADIYLDTAGME